MSWVGRSSCFAGVFESIWAIALGESHSFRRRIPTLIFAVALPVSMVGLAVAMNSLPTGTAYAVWVGIGASVTVLWGILERQRIGLGASRAAIGVARWLPNRAQGGELAAAWIVLIHPLEAAGEALSESVHSSAGPTSCSWSRDRQHGRAGVGGQDHRDRHPPVDEYGRCAHGRLSMCRESSRSQSASGLPAGIIGSVIGLKLRITTHPSAHLIRRLNRVRPGQRIELAERIVVAHRL